LIPNTIAQHAFSSGFCRFISNPFSLLTKPIEPPPTATASLLHTHTHTYISQLGVGRFSVVREGTERATSQCYAVKIINKDKLTTFYETKLRDEVEMLSILHHVNIIGLREVIEEPRFYYLILEKMQGGELFDHVVRKTFYTELQVRNACKMILSAIAHCHEHSIVHRDIKPENILLTVRYGPTYTHTHTHTHKFLWRGRGWTLFRSDPTLWPVPNIFGTTTTQKKEFYVWIGTVTQPDR
jgi:Protein kinase domain